MAVDYRVYDVPQFAIRGQLFHVPGASFQGAFTVGGARMAQAEPGGFSALEIDPSWQVNEWETPFASWIMSKINGAYLKVQLAKTPQVCRAALGLSLTFDAEALEGSTTAVVDMGEHGQLFKPGHVIGHGLVTYLIDEIEYDVDDVATITVTPPIRATIAADDPLLVQPYFVGQIINGSEVRALYEASEQGNIKIGKIVMVEAVLPNE